MKKLLVLLLAIALLISAVGCSAKTKNLHCDDCGAEIEVNENSEMNDEDWILFCEECEKAQGLDEFFEEE